MHNLGMNVRGNLSMCNVFWRGGVEGPGWSDTVGDGKECLRVVWHGCTDVEEQENEL